ncbi:U-box domain-containing protein 12-like [Zingiber officinale]|uniref:RING-type E3 ubiquitin transferase n=1 Tax=Zingiber officinale TaxID=94328 RepID=A0A8J5FNQ2_ZINOF|nr:U-box domain-containing protein 12-like [Zingiber officinale]KAG6491114.1 hypothetical protein ZIOFF_052446 [Zingiber officinale]
MAPTSEEEDAEVASGEAVDALLAVVSEVSALPEIRGPLSRMCCDLARRVKLLLPLFDELRDDPDSIGLIELRSLESLCATIVEAKDALRLVNEGSKIYQVLRREKFERLFLKVTESIEKALDAINLDRLNISIEVKEQTELVQAQLHRARGSMESHDLLSRDLNLALHENHTDPIVLKRISEKLQLKNKSDIMKESLSLHEMVTSSDGELDVSVEQMSSLLKKLKDCVLENSGSASIETTASFAKHIPPVIPDDFRCPISLELMKDPVIVSTGQTYERSYIQKWLESGHKTCPKTQQPLTHSTLTPNFVLKSLIAQWCDANGIELPQKQGSFQDNKLGNNSDCNHSGIAILLRKMVKGNQEEQRAAAGELRLLAKRNADNRICIAEAGAIPLLIQLLSSTDPRTQEHAVTALLNLSINEDNKSLIVKANALPKIVEVLESESMEARENAAAALFSLSVIDQNKILIGEAGAIPVLINLLCRGSPRGKKDAATALFNLCLYQGNKVIAVKAGIVGHLRRMLVDATGGMVDEALAILTILASSQEGKVAITNSELIPLLLKLMKTGSARVRENAAALLFSLCNGDELQLRAVKGLGAEEALKDLSETGTERAKRKAGSLLGLIHQITEVSGGDSSAKL